MTCLAGFLEQPPPPPGAQPSLLSIREERGGREREEQA